MSTPGKQWVSCTNEVIVHTFDPNSHKVSSLSGIEHEPNALLIHPFRTFWMPGCFCGKTFNRRTHIRLSRSRSYKRFSKVFLHLQNKANKIATDWFQLYAAAAAVVCKMCGATRRRLRQATTIRVKRVYMCHIFNGGGIKLFCAIREIPVQWHGGMSQLWQFANILSNILIW